MKIVNFITLLLSLFVLVSCSNPIEYNEQLTKILKELDNTIADKEQYTQIKDQRIDGIKSLLSETDSPEHTYRIYDNLYQEYFRYHLDTAMVYANRKLAVAERISNKNLIIKSKFDIAEAFTMAGMLNETKNILDEISIHEVDSSLLVDYYSSHHNFYREMKAICVYPSLEIIYEQKGDSCRQMVYSLLKGDRNRKLFIEASMKRKAGDNRGIIESLAKLLEDENVSVHSKAGAAFVIARAYDESGDTDNAIYYFTLSSIFDIKVPVHEHAALFKLASLLYEKKDMERAYRYINHSIEDALKVNSRKNIYQINQLLPIISQSYNAQMHQQQRKLIGLITGIGISMVSLIIAVIIVYISMKRISAAKKEQNRTNEELKKLNAKLTDTNYILLESNRIKEAYIGRYLDLCSNYINGVEQYRTNLNNILRKDGTAEVAKALKSSTYIKDELDEFYTNFDVTFLHIFPKFVEKFNDLLQEDKRISLKQGELLTTELRVFALIRLGITDSQKIAEFLRRSTSTIYNYRVKMRNAAINERQDFEKQVSNIV